ncbi:hypothetical protein Patl1_07587 [Pistacia atlantica]|nr:hypothetical protein Patl1_07586 [Pistacia atlantica]KAJ0085676.1 hypothetical protein Patl1_07587 [Pistacia atlantica]
MHSRRA